MFEKTQSQLQQNKNNNNINTSCQVIPKRCPGVEPTLTFGKATERSWEREIDEEEENVEKKKN